MMRMIRPLISAVNASIIVSSMGLFAIFITAGHQGVFIRFQKDLLSKNLVQNNISKHVINSSQQKYAVSIKLMLWKHNPLCSK